MAKVDPALIRQVYHQLGRNACKTAEALGINRKTVSRHLVELEEEPEFEPLVEGQIDPTPTQQKALPPSGVQRYILTSAQNNTKLNDQVWENLLALKDYFQAELFVGTYSYNLNAYGPLAVKRGSRSDHQFHLWYDDRLAPFISAGDNKNIEIAPWLLWCGRANILPTAERPLSGFETYAGRASGIFPHARIQMQSIPVNKHEPTKFNYTTGTVTQRNYVQKKAGLKAEHHHTYGALLVEVTKEGSWFVRQLNADSDGVIYDLDLRVDKGEVSRGHRVLAINWGDIHVAQGDEEAYEEAWGKNDESIIDTLRPEYQFMHDLLDFYSRNHHDIWNHQAMFRRYTNGDESIEKELAQVARFLHFAKREFCATVVVDSNHDGALSRWLRDADFKKDPVNAIFYLEAQLTYYKAIHNSESIHLLQWALNRAGCPVDTFFLRQDESFILHEKDPGGGIEFGMHGHLGPNGAKGSPQNLSRLGRKANTGHTHSAAIIDGLYVAGVTGRLDQSYNKGPSSWSQSHILTYGNGKRAIVTRRNGNWRA